MSVGTKIQWIRSQSKKTQQELAEATDLAVSYLSRLENGRITPTVRTLGKIAAALRVPLASFFEPEKVLEAADHCPVSLSGRCILDQVFTGRGQVPTLDVESYSPQQLEALRLCNFLLHTRDKELLQALLTMLRSFLALSEWHSGKQKAKPQAAPPTRP